MSQIKDIEIALDTTGRALPSRTQQAEQDALLLQAGLDMEPAPDAPAPRLDLSWMGHSTGMQRSSFFEPSPDSIGGSYFGSVAVTSPLTLAVHVLNFDVVNVDGAL